MTCDTLQDVLDRHGIRLQDVLDRHGIRYFSAHELLSRTPGSREKTEVPPRELWPNILPTLEFADEIREQMDRPVVVVSGWRSLKYNRTRNSSDTSEHVVFRALDLSVGADDYERLKAVTAAVMDHANARGIRTGYGYYDDPDDLFVHVDTGSTKGFLRRWKG